MIFYYTRSNDSKNRKYICTCDDCGSHNLEDPHIFDSDHRDVQGFYCMDCGHHTYYHLECKSFFWIDENGNEVWV